MSTMFRRAYADLASVEMDTTAIGHYIPYVTHQLTQIHQYLFGDAAYIFEQDAGPLQLRRKNVPM
jgi:hypothetical protein